MLLQTFRFKFSEEAEAPDEEKETTSPIFTSSNPNYGEGVCKMSVCHGEQTSWACVRPESYRNASENLVSKSKNKVEERNSR